MVSYKYWNEYHQRPTLPTVWMKNFNWGGNFWLNIVATEIIPPGYLHTPSQPTRQLWNQGTRSYKINDTFLWLPERASAPVYSPQKHEFLTFYLCLLTNTILKMLKSTENSCFGPQGSLGSHQLIFSPLEPGNKSH